MSDEILSNEDAARIGVYYHEQGDTDVSDLAQSHMALARERDEWQQLAHEARDLAREMLGALKRLEAEWTGLRNVLRFTLEQLEGLREQLEARRTKTSEP